MNELFRFVALRPPEAASDPIVIDGESPLAVRLAQARDGQHPREQMQRLAQSYRESDSFVQDGSSLNLPLQRFADALETADPAGQWPAEDGLVESTFGSTTADVAGSAAFAEDVARLQDSALAIKLTGSPNGEAAVVARLLGAANNVRRIAARQNAVTGSAPLILLPASIFPLPAGTGNGHGGMSPREPAGRSREQVQQELTARAEALGDALRALQTAEAPAAANGAREKTGQRALEQNKPTERVKKALQTNLAVSGPAPALFLDANALSRLAPGVQRTLSGLGIGLGVALPSVMHTLKLELGKTESLIVPTSAGAGRAALTFGPYNPLTEAGWHDDASDPTPATLANPPATHGQVKPAGIADLLVVRQHVLGYSAGEVAYVENVAPGEKLSRATHRSETVEDAVVTVNETSREQQRDLQATDRFDLQRELSEVLRADASRKPGAAELAAYGVVVETGSSSEQAQRAAETFGRDIATRAVSRVSERLRTEITHRTVQKFSEEVRHEFDNSAAAARKVVVYQWLDRVVQTQVFTYGKRVFYDFVLPEPAALMLRALAMRRAPDGPLVKPAPFTLKASQINEVNYLYYVAGYGATGVEPPPEPQIVVSEPQAKNSQNKYAPQPEQRSIHEAQKVKVTIPPGYAATTACVNTMSPSEFTEGGPRFGITIGRHYIDLAQGAVLHAVVPLDGEVGSLPITLISSEGDSFYTVNVEILCEPTERSLDAWRQRTADAILQAARQRLQEYEEKAANLRAAVRIDALNFTLERRRSAEREDLERACLEVLTQQHFDGLSAIEHSAQGYPQAHLPNVEPLGRYVRFLQQAFEWEQMTWRYYPYFWGRKSYWLDKMLLDDSDPQFREFLRAGSARVQLSVRPGFKAAVAHFMDTGTVPTVAELGLMASGQFLPFLAEETGADVDIEAALPYGEPWELRAPTALVKLRADQTLPAWKAAADAKGRVTWIDATGDPV